MKAIMSVIPKVKKQETSGKTIKVHAERDSVCMGDDCTAPNAENLIVEENADMQDLMQTVLKYVPNMSSCRWTVKCRKDIIGILAADENGRYRITATGKYARVSDLPEKKIFCRYSYEKNTSKTVLPAEFTVYNLFDPGTKLRILKRKTAPESRLEKYIIRRTEDGHYELFEQEGWFAGSHYDGGGGSNPIPDELFSLSWDAFLDGFCKRFPEEDYGFGKEELKKIEGLREFLGIHE